MKKRINRENMKAEEKKPMIRINPPPIDKKCDCCGKFKGSNLIKNFRKMAPKEILNDFKEKDFTNEKYLIALQLVNTVSASWECQDCMQLDDLEYHKIKSQTIKERKREMNKKNHY